MKPEEPPIGGSPDPTISLSTGYIAPLFEENQFVEEIEKISLEDQNDALKKFREQWKQEISHPKRTEGEEQKKEDQARNLFLEGVECEKRGEMAEAVHNYTKAMKLVPDIEKKIHSQVLVSRARSTSRTRGNAAASSKNGSNENNLLRVFQDRLATRGNRFLGTTENFICYLNRLPVEILTLLIRYMIGKEINLKALENLSEVSIGMYCLARNDDLWKRIHCKSFGKSNIELIGSFTDWRKVYLSFPHLRFDGIYLTKVTYIRHGETGFQDKNFRPWHTVAYYRFLRFFPDGNALMTTSSDSPQQVANLLKYRPHSKVETSICSGTWYQEDDLITLQVHREYQPPPKPKYSRHKKHVAVQEYGILKHTFRIVLRIYPLKQQGKWCLQWLENHCTITYFNGHTTTNDLDADKNSQEFPPMRYHRVKSYTENCSSKF